jgi:hypothetical protein
LPIRHACPEPVEGPGQVDLAHAHRRAHAIGKLSAAYSERSPHHDDVAAARLLPVDRRPEGPAHQLAERADPGAPVKRRRLAPGARGADSAELGPDVTAGRLADAIGYGLGAVNRPPVWISAAG